MAGTGRGSIGRRPLVVVLSGALCAGKTTLAGGLCAALNGRVHVVSAREALRQRAGADLGRVQLQHFGIELERATAGTWLADATSRALDERADDVLIVDSARTLAQITHLRGTLPAPVVHIHLHADSTARAQRFAQRQDGTDAGVRFAEVEEQGVELSVEALRLEAHLAVDTTLISAAAMCDTALAYLIGVRSRSERLRAR